MSTYNYDAMVEMIWKEKTDQIFADNNIAKRTFRKDPDPSYTKMSEWAHGKILHQYLKEIWLEHTHIGLEAWQSWTKNIVIMMAKKKAQGTAKWFPDYIVYTDTDSWSLTIYIELKKSRWVNWWLNWSKISEEQIEWLNFLKNIPFSYANICHGSIEAIAFVDEILAKHKNLSLQESLESWINYPKKNFILF